LTAANPDLDAEHLVGAELGAEYLLPHAGALRATGFMNWLDKPIINETLDMPLPGGATRQRRNLGQARIRGVELSADLRPVRWLTAMGAYTLADNKVLESASQAELVGRRLPQDPVHRGRASLTANAGRFLASVQARTQSHQYEDDKNTLLMKAYLLIDAFVSVGLGGDVEIYGSAQNIMDRKYLVGRAGLDTIGPPRLVLVGLRVHR
jgi:outer membrane receptor protein involved in Fe transport